MKIAPTLLSERVEGLDFLRGIALLGILLANMLHFHSPYAYMDPYTQFTGADEQTLFMGIDVFIEASFYPLFAMLFGYGINMKYEKSLKSQMAFAPFMARRLALLMVFGLIHALLIWSGDILFTYALMGLAMIVLVKIPKKWLFSLALVLYIVPSLLLYVVLSIGHKINPNALLDGFIDTEKISMALATYGRGTLGEIVTFRWSEFISFQLFGAITSVVAILPLLMLGAAFSKAKIIERMVTMKGTFVLVMVLFMSVGLLVKTIPYWDAPTFENIFLVQSMVGGPLLTIGYASLFLLVWQVPFLRVVTQPFATIGRMAFTTYIMQSIFATLLFYSYGAGLYGKVSIGTGTLLAVGIFVIQLVFAHIWLSKFRMGPLEFMWRKWSYGKNFVFKEEKI